MPYISGFDLIKAVSKRINCKFIIVTASDFNYVNKQFNAACLILRPPIRG